MSDPAVSIIIPAWRAWGTIHRVLDALAKQIDPLRHEVFVVDSTADGRATGELECYPFVTPIILSTRALPGRARNIAMERARGALVVFLDADAVPAPDWLTTLERSMRTSDEAVAGRIMNGTPSSAIGTAGYLLEFSDWAAAESRAIQHGATANLAIRRGAIPHGFPEDIFPGEDTIATYPIGRAGKLRYEPSASVRHLNRTDVRSFFRHQRALGRCFAAVCARVDFPYRRLGTPAMAVLAVPFRALAVAGRIRQTPGLRSRAIVLSPLLVLGLLAWGWGLATAPRERHR